MTAEFIRLTKSDQKKIIIIKTEDIEEVYEDEVGTYVSFIERAKFGFYVEDKIDGIIRRLEK